LACCASHFLLGSLKGREASASWGNLGIVFKEVQSATASSRDHRNSSFANRFSSSVLEGADLAVTVAAAGLHGLALPG
jgi:hypothetical protein